MPGAPLPILSADAAAAALRRGLPSSAFSTAQLVAIAQKALGSIQEDALAPAEYAATSTHRDLAVTVAGRLLDTTAGLVVEGDPDAATRLSLLSSIAFASVGNWPSARAAGHHLIPRLTEEPLFAVALGSCIPSLLGQILDQHRNDALAGDYLRLLNAFLSRGNPDDGTRLLPMFNACLAECLDPFTGAALRSARPAVHQIVTLSTARALSNYETELPAGMIQRLIDAGIKTLLPGQLSALMEDGLLRESTNCIISYPTSTGKTLLGELCLARRVGRLPGTGVYIAPYVAIGRQTAHACEQHFPPGCRIHRLFGAYAPTRQAFGVDGQDFIVCTPERFDGLLRASPSLLDTLRVVVVDEGHMVENSTRGMRLEALLTRLRMIQRRRGSPQIVLLSAVVADTSSLREWLGVDEHRVYKSHWRPSIGRIAVWTQDGVLEWRASTDVSVSDQSAYPIGQLTLPWPATGIRPTSNFGWTKQQEPKLIENVAFLCDFLYRQLRGPVLVVSATKRGTREIARTVAERLPPFTTMPRCATQAIELIAEQHPTHRSMVSLLQRGVAFHNASVPHDLRELIEEAVKERELRIVASTTTLAEGVDLPFRTTVLADWLVWGAVGQQPMSRLLFRNIVGRSGRAGRFTEGDTVLVDNPLGDTRFTQLSSRRALQQELLQEPPQLGSAIQAAAATTALKDDLYGVLSSQLLAAIPENPEQEELATEFADSLLASRLTSPMATRTVLNRAADELLDEHRGALARAASPLQLTPLGEAVKMTGLSARTARMLISFMHDADRTTSVAAVGAELLTAFADVPEQTNYDLAKVVASSRSKFCVKPDDFGDVIRELIDGTSMLDLFSMLPFVQRSRRRPTLDEWLEGQPAPTWEELYDKYIAFLQDAVQSFLPWLLRSCAALQDHLGDAATWPGLDWSAAADLLEASPETD